MDGLRFDALARSLTGGVRRRVLAAAIGAALAPLLGRPDGEAHNALKKCNKLKDKDKKKKCRKKAKKHNATHKAASGCTPNCNQRICGDDGCGGSCGTCSTPIVPDCCDGICTSHRRDPANCGACGAACAPGEACLNGSCAAVCSPPCGGATPVCCASGCTDTTIDRDNCGTCGRRCAASEYCQNSACVSPARNCGETALCGACDAIPRCECRHTKSGDHPACISLLASAGCEECTTHQECQRLGYGSNSLCMAPDCLTCATTGACSVPCDQELPCLLPGRTCSTNANCCSNRCSGGICRYPAGVCLAPSVNCRATHQCCSGTCTGGGCSASSAT